MWANRDLTLVNTQFVDVQFSPKFVADTREALFVYRSADVLNPTLGRDRKRKGRGLEKSKVGSILTLRTTEAARILLGSVLVRNRVVAAKEWFDQVSISDADRVKIARANAQKLFRL